MKAEASYTNRMCHIEILKPKSGDIKTVNKIGYLLPVPVNVSLQSNINSWLAQNLDFNQL